MIKVSDVIGKKKLTDEEQVFKTLYYKLSNMKDRCRNPKNKCHKYYYDKGIDVCSEWNDFNNFYTWALENGYKLGLTIERKNTDKGYSPDNCCFIPMKEQPVNTDRNVYIQFNDKILTQSEVARIEHISPEAVRKRIRKGLYKTVLNPNKVKLV